MASAIDETHLCERLQRERSILGLPPLPEDGLSRVAEAVARDTAAGTTLAALLALGRELGEETAPGDDVAAWAASLRRLDALAYAVRLVEAQIFAGNSGDGIMLPDARLVI
jgi:RecB family exonuclease